jgi:hypothetical protein
MCDVSTTTSAALKLFKAAEISTKIEKKREHQGSFSPKETAAPFELYKEM